MLQMNYSKKFYFENSCKTLFTFLNICLLGKQDKNQNQKCKQPTQLFVYQTCANESNNGRFKDGGGTITLMIVSKTQKSSAI